MSVRHVLTVSSCRMGTAILPVRKNAMFAVLQPCARSAMMVGRRIEMGFACHAYQIAKSAMDIESISVWSVVLDWSWTEQNAKCAHRTAMFVRSWVEMQSAKSALADTMSVGHTLVR